MKTVGCTHPGETSPPNMPERMIAVAVTIASLVFLALLGAIGAAAGGAAVTKAVVRVTFWGALAMAATAGIGKLFGTVV